MTTNSWRKILLHLHLVGTVLISAPGDGLAAVQSSANYGMTANILSASGGAATSAGFGIKSAAGQSSAIGQSSSASYRLSAGFFLPLQTSPPATAPSATTNQASSVSSSGATLNGTANDNGANTTVTFDYGLTSGYGSSVAATTGGTISAGSGDSPASVAITGLNCNTTYHFRVNAQNSAGSTNGSDMTFTTSACPKQNQTIGTISFLPGSLLVGGSVTASATSTSGLAVTFSSLTTSICTVSGNTVTGVAAGTCTIAADQSGNAGYNSAPQVTQNITVTTPPQLNLTVSALSNGSVTTETTQNISGIVTNSVSLSLLTVNGSAVQVGPDGSFSYPVQLVAGGNTVTVIAVSITGHTITDTRTLTLDTTAPHLTVTYPPDNKVVVQQYITVIGEITDLFTTAKSMAKTLAATTGIAVTYTVNGSSSQAASVTGSTYSFTANLSRGMNTIQVSAVDDTGKTAQVKRTASYIPTFSLSVTDPASDIRTVHDSYLLNGEVMDNTTPVTVTVGIDGNTYTPTIVNGVFQQQLLLSSPKVYQVSITGVDQNNNSVTVQRNIIRTIPKAEGAGDPLSIVDALLSLQMSVGLIAPQTDQILRLDVAPMVNGVSAGDGKVDVEDALVILRMIVGLI